MLIIILFSVNYYTKFLLYLVYSSEAHMLSLKLGADNHKSIMGSLYKIMNLYSIDYCGKEGFVRLLIPID